MAKTKKIIVSYSDSTKEIYRNQEHAEDAILEALAESVTVEKICDAEGSPYSCIWTVKLQKES